MAAVDWCYDLSPGAVELFILLIIVAVSIAWSRGHIISAVTAVPTSWRMRSESHLVCADVLSVDAHRAQHSVALMCSHSRAHVLTALAELWHDGDRGPLDRQARPSGVLIKKVGFVFNIIFTTRSKCSSRLPPMVCSPPTGRGVAADVTVVTTAWAPPSSRQLATHQRDACRVRVLRALRTAGEAHSFA